MKTHILAVTVLLAGLAGLTPLSRAHAEDAAGGYRLVENWGQLPKGTKWGVMSAIGVDPKGNVYAFQRDKPVSKILVFDEQGKFLRAWGEGGFPGAHGLRVMPDGAIWATDKISQQVLKFDLSGKLLMSLGRKGVTGDMNSHDAFNGVSDVAVAANGDIFVSDGEDGNNRIVKFSKDGKFIAFWGTKGAGPGQLDNPHALAIDSKGRIWVCDRANKRLQLFDQNGKYLSQMTQFGVPASIFIKGDRVYVAGGPMGSDVLIGTTDGKILATIGGFNHPHGIAVDASGAIYVSEVVPGETVLKYVKK